MSLSQSRESDSTISVELLSNPSRISSAIENRPNRCDVVCECVENRVREYPAEKSVIVLVNHPVDPASDLQPFDVSPETCEEVISHPFLLRLIKPETVLKILQSVVRDPNGDHPVLAFL